jgi:hypothetical protein
MNAIYPNSKVITSNRIKHLFEISDAKYLSLKNIMEFYNFFIHANRLCILLFILQSRFNNSRTRIIGI